MIKLDSRYTVALEWCGYDQPRNVARFCGEWLHDSELWPDRDGNQAPSFKLKRDAVKACRDYEQLRQGLISDGLRQQAYANFYEANR